MLTYATVDDLTVWTGQIAPDNATQLLRSASGLVRRSTVTAIYTAAPSGAPSDPDVAEAFRDATCAQAAFWAVAGIDPAAGQVGAASERLVSASSIGGAAVTYGTAGDVAAAKTAALDELCNEAAFILAEAGMLGQPWATG